MFNFRLLKYIYIRIFVLNKMEDESDSDSSVDELKIQQLKEAAVCAESIVTECKSKIVILVPLFISFIWRMNISQTRYSPNFLDMYMYAFRQQSVIIASSLTTYSIDCFAKFKIKRNQWSYETLSKIAYNVLSFRLVETKIKMFQHFLKDFWHL